MHAKAKVHAKLTLPNSSNLSEEFGNYPLFHKSDFLDSRLRGNDVESNVLKLVIPAQAGIQELKIVLV